MPTNVLAQLAETLNSVSNDTESLDMIVMVNEEIAAWNLGIELWRGSRNPRILIGFAKLDTGDASAWQLAVREKDYGVDNKPTGAFSYTPLLRASRDLRIEGLGLVPTILACLKHEARGQQKEHDEASCAYCRTRMLLPPDEQDHKQHVSTLLGQ